QCRYRIVQKTVLAWDIFRFPSGPHVDLVNYFEVGATYYFNKNMSTYVDYIINQIDSDNKLGVGSDDTVAVGIVYQF
ncbi:porin, partial [Escherichia coli]|uniref:porin n=1 Tax=Escherichia coli TaxID=562 RepID=UPI00202381AD